MKSERFAESAPVAQFAQQFRRRIGREKQIEAEREESQQEAKPFEEVKSEQRPFVR